MEATKSDNQLITNIEKNLRGIATMTKQNGRGILDDYSITPPQFIALQWILEYGAMTIGDLSQKMYLACSTTTDLVDRLEKAELVKRMKDPNDRRVVQIHLLQKGESIIYDVIQKRQNYLSQLLNNFSDQEKEQLDYLLSLLHDEI